MRIIFVLAIWASILSGLFFYMETRGRMAQDPAPFAEQMEAAGSYRLEITTLAPLEPDPFALTAGVEMSPETILVRLNGKALLSRRDRIESGSSLIVDPVPGLISGLNELYLGATPPLGKTSSPAAVRVQMFSGLVPLLDETLWSEGGLKIFGAIPFSLPAAEPKRGTP